MGNTVEEVIDVPLIYPLVSVTFRSVAIVNGRRLNTECETVLNMDLMSPLQATAELGKVLHEFEEYVAKTSALAGSEQGERELQNILDTSAQAKSQLPADHPLSQSPSLAGEQDPGTLPSN